MKGCGGVLGHGEYCQEGYLCHSCEDKIVYTKRIELLKQDIEWLLSFVEPMFPEKIPEGLPAIFYHTLSESGDKKIAERVKLIRSSLNVK